MNESKNAALLFKVSLLLTASFLGPNKTGKQTAAEGLLGGTRTRSGLCAPSQVAFTFGLRFTSATNTVLIYGTALLQGMFLGFVLSLECPNLRGVVDVGLAIMGVGAIVYGGPGASGSSLSADLLVLSAAACWGFYTTLSLSLLRRYSPLSVAAYPRLFGALAVSTLACRDLRNIGRSG